MKISSAIALFYFQIAFVNAFEIPFKLPFGLNIPFIKSLSSPELFELHKQLINIPSVTGSEYDVGVFLADYLTEKNYTVERIPSHLKPLTALICSC
jgi:acetylornithine deacetylase